MMHDASPASFTQIGDDPPASPVVLSVPHAGREYPLPLRAALRVPLPALQPLEDRHIDAVALAARGRETMLVQHRARAWIDLNRAEHERDPLIDTGADPMTQPIASAKVRGGLGLVPRRVGGVDLWRRRFDAGEIKARIADDHRPYHAALARALAAARARFGVAVLLDIHSMPSPARGGGAQLVIGDRFGRSAAARLVHRIESVATAHGLSHALNTPYAGGHILDRHAAPARGIHAVQLEFDRALYLDAATQPDAAGVAHTAAVLQAVIAALADEAVTRLPLAAE